MGGTSCIEEGVVVGPPRNAVEGQDDERNAAELPFPCAWLEYHAVNKDAIVRHVDILFLGGVPHVPIAGDLDPLARWPLFYLCGVPPIGESHRVGIVIACLIDPGYPFQAPLTERWKDVHGVEDVAMELGGLPTSLDDSWKETDGSQGAVVEEVMQPRPMSPVPPSPVHLTHDGGDVPFGLVHLRPLLHVLNGDGQPVVRLLS